MGASTRNATNRGSSPREWGKRHGPACLLAGHRVIPTRVGKAAALRIRARFRSGHPHASGESLYPEKLTIPNYGSSPREWGKLLFFPPLCRAQRVIPTRVGKAGSRRCDIKEFPGHPHASGESSGQGMNKGLQFGSSPREWGKPRPQPRHLIQNRVIPTRVGKA